MTKPPHELAAGIANGNREDKQREKAGEFYEQAACDGTVPQLAPMG